MDRHNREKNLINEKNSRDKFCYTFINVPVNNLSLKNKQKKRSYLQS